MAYRNDYEQLLRDIQSSGQNWSDYDLQLAREDPDVGRSLFTQKQNYANAQTDAERRAANSAAEMLRAQYGGYTGGSDGTGYMKAPSVAKSDKTPNYAPAYTEYVSKYADQIDSLLGEIMNREPFSYSPNADPTFQAYAEKYRNLGNQSRKNVMGEAAAMTGGMPNSFAIAASQQAQDGYNAQLTDAIPALKQLAYDMYLGDIDQKRADLSSMMGLDEMYYGRHQDSYNNQLNQWQANYNVDRDLISDARYENETEYDRAMDRAALLAQAGDYSGYAALGYSADQIAALQAASVSTGRSSGGGGGGGSEPVAEEQDEAGLYAAAMNSSNPANFIASDYKKYGFTSSTGLQDGFKSWEKSQVTSAVNYASQLITLNGRDANFLYNALAKKGYADGIIDAAFVKLGL